MLRTKKDVDQHVEGLLVKLSSKEFISRGYSIGRLYYEVGDNSSCRRYVEQYLNQNNNNAAAHALLGHALQKLGLKEKALEEFKTAFTFCPSQNSLVLNICEILADGEVDIDPGRAKYWCDKAETMFPKHPVTYQLREKLLSISNPDPEALANFLTEELVVRPKDVLLHIRLLQFYLKNNKIQEAFTHTCNVEFGENNFTNNFDWYNTVEQILKSNPRNTNDWLFQLLFLTVMERMFFLNLTVNHSDSYSKMYETTHLLHEYDQAIERVAKAGIDTSHLEFHKCLLHHHRSQFAFLAATFLLKSGKDRNCSDATMDAESLMLITWHSSVFDLAFKWVITAPEIQQNAARRWYRESSYRCSQSGHFLLANINDKKQAFLDRISHKISETQWKTKLYGKIFSSKYHLDKIETSHMISSLFSAPTLRLPKRNEVELYDEEAQRAYGGSLHHFVWMLLNYHDYSHFKCTTFEMLPMQIRNDSNCGPESLCQLDIYAFLFCATLASKQTRSNKEPHKVSHKPKTLPANITEWLCTSAQRKWWDCAYKFSRNELGTEMTDIRATLSRGIEIVRCIDNHGLDPELLCQLGRIFSNKAKHATDIDEKRSWEMRAVLYFSSAIPLFEKTRSTLQKLDGCLFEYVNTCLLPKETRSLLEECKLYVAFHQLNDGDHEKAIKLLSNARSAKALYYLGLIYKKMALEEINYHDDNLNEDANSKSMTLLSKAQNYGYEALSKLRDPENKSNHSLHMETEELLREIEIHLSKINYVSASNEKHDKNSSDEYISLHGNEEVLTKNQSLFLRNFSSTPKRSSNVSNYRTPVSSQIVERTDQQSFDRLESQISILQKRDAKMNDYMEQTKNMCEENREIGNQIISMINSNMKSTTDQFAQLKISIDKVKDEIDECRNECKDVGELKKQIAQMKKDINNLKESSSERVESELFNLDEEYRANDNPSTFAAQLPFSSQQVLPSFNQRIIPPFSVPPNPFQLYGQNLFNLYNHYSQFSQPQSVPGAPPIFDAARTQVNYPGVFPATDQMYLDAANLVQQTMPTAPPVPVIPTTVSVPASMTSTLPVVSLPHATAATTTKTVTQIMDNKDMSRSLPANVVITSSDPLPTCTSTPTPILSVTIPAKHIKNIPHNYQIQMPATEPVPAFGFPTLGNKMNIAPASSNWNKTTVFKDFFPSVNSSGTVTNTISFSPNVSNTNVIDEDANTSNESHNKSRTLSERSNTYVDNYDPCPDFKPIIPLPAEVKVTTGEEDETVVFSARAKLYRFVDNQWKERGLGEMKLLKHNITGKVRVLMRREQIHKICANHIITPEMDIKPMKNETKAYFWVANDFAEETLILEKFSIRFKTADIARQFYEAFEKARLESTNTDKQSKVPEISKAKDKSKTTSVNESLPTKTVVGGFTFSSTPAFKPVDDSKPLGKQQETTVSPKVNIFSGLNLKTDPSSTSFTNWFSSSTSQKLNDPEKDETVNKANVSDSVEAYEPTVEFEPVVPLPALVDTKTGEEDEIILFEQRAKLLRFDASSKEWKERGLGNIKLLVNKDNVQKLRLLMRREQVMKVCCNHTVTKAMSFQKMPKRDQAVTWYAQDYSEGELTPELFCLRFKTTDECDRFIDTVKTAQSKLKDDSKAAKEEQNAAKQNSQIGDNIVNQVSSKWGDKFKPKEGSWECKECLIRNEQSAENCSACNNPRISDAALKESKLPINNETKFIAGEPLQNSNNNKAKELPSSNITGWGDKFKPKQGSWECQSCLVRNEPNIDICSACNTSRHAGGAKPESKVLPKNEMNFKFGIPTQSTAQVSKSTAPVNSTWGDKFKPSAGTWECKICYVRNNSNVETCSACNNSKEPIAVAKPTASVWPSSKFNFGIPSNSSTDGQQTTTTSIFDGTGFHKFNFGIPSNTQGQSNNMFSKEDKTQNLHLTTKLGNQELVNNSIQTTETKPALLPTPQKPAESVTFDFVFKPKTQTKAKSPMKSPGNERGEESDGNEYASEDEGHHIEITPIIPMPDKVKVVTGEEDEDELYGHRAKLLKFVSGEWKERGIGVVKVLKHKLTGKLRVVMRREQIFKICLNHALTPDINYNLKDEKNWIFAANDFSEGELSIQSFCLKFKTKEIALEFKNAIDKAREGINTSVQNKQKVENKDTEDVQFITETQSNPEEKKKATDLMLPENFYLYKDKALLPTPQKPAESVTFDFVFKPKPQTKAKSPMKSPGNERGEESDGNEYASEDEGHHIEITPIIPMPDKVKVVTGEEDEDELYGHRAKLLKFVSGEWKERGIGVVKVLKHKLTGKLRVVMRREQIFKICLNHALTPDLNYNLKDEKNWIFAANDFSEGELSIQSFCLKFKTKEIALEFKNAIDKAREGINTSVQNKQKVENKDTEDVQFITETQSNPEEKKKATDLMLPENFYLYKDKDPCPGCRGCKEDNHTKSNVPENTAQSLISNSKNPVTVANEPIDLTPELKVPAVSEKEVNSDKDVTKKERSILQKPKLFSIDTQSSVFKTPVFNAPPSTTTTTDIDQKTDPKSIFAAANVGMSANNFSFLKPSDNKLPEAKTNTDSAVNNKSSIEPSSAVKSIFDGETTQNKFNFFGHQSNQSLSTQTSIFSSGNASNLFSNGPIWSVNTKTDFKTPSDLTTKAPGFGSGETLGFDTFSKQPEIKFQTNPDFKWAGAGQQIFASTTSQKEKPEATSGKDTNKNTGEDVDNVEEEEYDPHYEPIVPLPDKITVTTGEEDEEKLYGARCKLYRYNNSSEWKERGVGELKILYHPVKKTYRLLFRREQVYKAVLNMLLHPDLELLPMKNADRAWTWAGRNFAESTAGESETLAVRFKTKEMACEFFDKVKDCVRKLQAAAAQAIREKQEKKEENVVDDQPKSMAHLRLPKHLQDSARADNEMAMSSAQYSQAASIAPEPAKESSVKYENVVDDQPKSMAYLRLPKHLQDSARADNEMAMSSAQYSQAASIAPEPAKESSVKYENVVDDQPKSMAHLRLPKHLQDSARADNEMAMSSAQYSQAASIAPEPAKESSVKYGDVECYLSDRVYFEPAQKDADEEDPENYEQIYYQGDDYVTYYEEEESTAQFSCQCEATVSAGEAETACAQAQVQLVYDRDMYSAKILVSNAATGELLAEMLLLDDTEFQLEDASVSWSGTDYASNNGGLETTVTVGFPDSETAQQFHACCELNKGQNLSGEPE